MGRMVYRVSKKEPLQNYFRSYFFAGLFFNFIGVLSCLSVKYYDEEITKAQWKGVFTGFAFSIVGLAGNIIASSAIQSTAVYIIIALFLLSAEVLFGILYKYKGNGKAKQSITEPKFLQNISPQEASPWIEFYLAYIGISQDTIKKALSDTNLSKCFMLIQKNPFISKEDFLIAMDLVDDQNFIN